MLTWQITTAGGKAQRLGVLVHLSPSLATSRFSHTGINTGFKTVMIGHLAGRGIIIMTNSD
jgi:hypothetical protein